MRLHADAPAKRPTALSVYIVYIVYRALCWLLLPLGGNSYGQSILRLAFSRERVKPSRRYSQITRSEGFCRFCKHPANRSLLFCAAVLRFFQICLPKDSGSFASIVDHDLCGLFYKYSLDRFLRSTLIPGTIDHFERIYFDTVRTRLMMSVEGNRIKSARLKALIKEICSREQVKYRLGSHFQTRK